jgi:hypothetical protein
MAIQPEEVVHLLELDLLEQGLLKLDSLLPDMTIIEAAAFSLRKSIVSKWQYDNSQEADSKALVKFLASNKRCQDWSLPRFQTDCGPFKEGDLQLDSYSEMLLNGFKAAVYSFWNRDGFPLIDSPIHMLEKARIGPGSNIDANGGDFYTKFFSSPLTGTTSSLYNWYRFYTSNFPEWSNAENIRIENYGTARIVKGSRLSFVPKNDKISRCICTEPTLNTYFQLGLGWHLERRLDERFGISLSTQQFKNRDLARLGSITDNLITLDLSSASDSISLSMLRETFPPDFVRWLEFSRCVETQIPGMGTHQLYMVSSMGNGYTFPLQTCIFSCVVAACLKFRGIPLTKSKSTNSWGVFGDDIICPRIIARDVLRLLDLLGFVVNSDKSFVEGPFRESCGSDFYLGTNIRGVYLKTLETQASRYVAINQLLRFVTQHGIALSRVIGRIARESKYLPVPPWANSDSGIHTPISMARPRKDKSTQSYFFICLEPVIPRIRVLEDRIVVPRRQKRRIYNPSGLLISFLQGSVDSYSIGFRTETVKYKRKRRIAPFWVPSVGPPRDHQDYGVDWGRWESVVESYSKELGFNP